jgi:Phage major capsid protein E
MILDIFRNDAFGVLELTDVLNKQPFVPGWAGQVIAWEDQSVSTPNVAIEENQGVVKLISTSARGTPANQNTPTQRKVRALRVPHLAVEDTVTADEVQGVRELGTDSALQGVQSVVNQRLGQMGQNLDLTLEHLRVGALKGTILDADGVTPIVNLFTELNVPVPAVVDLDLATTPEGALRPKLHGIKRTIAKTLGNAPFRYLHAFCGSAFYDAASSNVEIRAAFKFPGDAAFLRADLAAGGGGGAGQFQFAGVIFQEYFGGIGDTPFVADDEAIFFPVGVPGLYRQYWAPADFNETANTPGRPRYAKQAVDPEFQRYVKLHVQSNPLPLVTRPNALIRATA